MMFILIAHVIFLGTAQHWKATLVMPPPIIQVGIALFNEYMWLDFVRVECLSWRNQIVV
jgi:hypothetical protein